MSRKIKGYIFEEDDYSKFKKLEDNREVLQGRMDKLVASFSEGEILNPIVVNEKMQIIDGQGRYEAKKALGLPIYYVVSPGAKIEDCRRMNRYNIKWAPIDFIKSFSNSGNPNYMRLLNIINEFKCSVTRITNMLGGRSCEISKKIESGNFKFDEKDDHYVRNIIKMEKEVLYALQYGRRPNEAFSTALRVIFNTNGYVHKRMLRNCELKRSTFVNAASLEEQLKEFSRIYNYNATQSNKLYFEDYMRNRGHNIRDYYKNDYSHHEGVDISTLKAPSKRTSKKYIFEKYGYELEK